jgi:hypothetical protein
MNFKFSCIASLFLILFLSSYKRPTAVNSWTKKELKGKIKSLTQIKCSLDTGVSNKKNTLEYFQEKYNEKGQIIEWKKFNPDSSLDFKYIYFYNELGQEFEAKQYGANDSLLYRWDSKFDKKGNRIEYIAYTFQGKLIGRNTSKFNRKGKEIVWKLHNNDVFSDVSIYSKKRYNLKGQMTSSKSYEANGQLYFSKHFKYDRNGNLIEERVVYDKTNRYTSTYIYNKAGDMTQSNGYNFKKRKSHSAYFEYVYDSTGNWIKKTEFRNKKIYFTTEREIEYFK